MDSIWQDRAGCALGTSTPQHPSDLAQQKFALPSASLMQVRRSCSSGDLDPRSHVPPPWWTPPHHVTRDRVTAEALTLTSSTQKWYLVLLLTVHAPELPGPESVGAWEVLGGHTESSMGTDHPGHGRQYVRGTGRGRRGGTFSACPLFTSSLAGISLSLL